MNDKIKFRIGDRVEWMDSNNVKQTGEIIETSYDPVLIDTKYLIKLNNGIYQTAWGRELRGVEDGTREK